MTWIRSPGWDGFWFLSFPVLGVLMLFYPFGYGWLLSLDLAHVISPIVLAWGHKEYRRMMLLTPVKFVGVPVVLLVVGVLVAWLNVLLFPHYQHRNLIITKSFFDTMTLDNLRMPIAIYIVTYFVWNLYHVGMQNFGMWCLYLRRGYKGRQRFLQILTFVGATVILGYGIFTVIHTQWLYLFIFGSVFAGHWFTAIGLSSHVLGRRHDCHPAYIASGILAGGLLLGVVFILGFTASAYLSILALCLRGSLGIWHFLQDRWVWKLSDPRVRASIGRDIFPDG
jgi:hypothetical protein